VKRTSPSGVRSDAACSLAIAAAALGLLLQNCAVLGQDALESLPSLQQKIIAAAAKAKPSVVRVIWRHHNFDDSASGVILTADGYTATFVNMSYRAPESRYDVRIPAGQSVSVHLADGRRLPGVAIGSFFSEKDLNFDLIKITENGVWPCATIGRAEAMKPGETCLALGFPPGPGGSREREPSVRIGHLIPWEAAGMLRSSCRLSGLGDRGGGLFDLDGRLIGIHLHFQPYSDYQTLSDPATCHLDFKVVEQNWRSLTSKKLPTGKPIPGRPATNAEAAHDATLPPIPSPDMSELAMAAAGVREATVALTTSEAPFGCSGTIVTPDGYIATCAHHHLARGAKVTVYFFDGRSAAATILGRDDAFDVGLAKLATRGPWPCIAPGKASYAKAGDPCIIAGYPNYLRKNGKVPLVVRGARIADLRYAPADLLSSCQVWSGDSGGGLFDTQCRLIGVLSGPADPRKVLAYAGADAFAALWDQLVRGPALSDPVPFEASPLAATMRKASEGLPNIVCDVLGNGKRRALGTIVSQDGFVLTKASELYGSISCRLADGRVLPAAARNVAREHDLALLKIEATGLPQIVWSPRRELPVGTLVTALGNGTPATMGVVSYPTHEVPPVAGFLGIGKVKDAQGGVEVEQLLGFWRSSAVEQIRRSDGMSNFESPIRVGDIISGIEGRPVPDSNTFEKLTPLRADGVGRDVPFVIAGDPICVALRRGGKELNLRIPLLAVNWNAREKTSPRSGSFPAVFETDVRLARDMCGGPLVDMEGQVVGITIALPVSSVIGSPVMPRVFVVPASVAHVVANQRK
jgi:serine protease Do